MRFLLIDEIDRGSNKLLAIQGVLEGNPVLIKKINEIVTPAKEFTIIATANTKGQGDDSGRFIAANVLDEAFIERFMMTFEQPYPKAKEELSIVKNHMIYFGVNLDEAEKFSKKLVDWSQVIRKTYNDGGIEELITTRRLCHIAQTFSIFNNRQKAIKLCINRFDDDTKSAHVGFVQ